MANDEKQTRPSGGSFTTARLAAATWLGPVIDVRHRGEVPHGYTLTYPGSLGRGRGDVQGDGRGVGRHDARSSQGDDSSPPAGSGPATPPGAWAGLRVSKSRTGSEATKPLPGAGRVPAGQIDHDVGAGEAPEADLAAGRHLHRRQVGDRLAGDVVHVGDGGLLAARVHPHVARRLRRP